MDQSAFRRLLLLGAGHGHLDLLKHLRPLTAAGVEVTVVSPEPEGLYSGMIPGLLGERYTRRQVTLPVREITESGGGTFIEDYVTAISAARREVTLASGRRCSYDVLSVAMGSVVAADRLPQLTGGPEDGVFTVKPFANVDAARARVREALAAGRARAVVVGGGPAAVEIAGNLARLGRGVRGSVPDAASSTRAAGTLEVALVCGGEPLAQFPSGCRERALGELRAAGVAVCGGGRAARVEPGRVVLEDDSEERGDIIIVAPGVKPPPVLAASDLPTAEDGALEIDETMRVAVDHPVFAAGDSSHLTSTPLPRIGAHALRGGEALRRNLSQLVLRGDIPRPARYSPTRSIFLALNLGTGRATACFRRRSLHGRWVFAIKELIDTSFMRNTVRAARSTRTHKNARPPVAAG